MAGKKGQFDFHGDFLHKRDAVKREKKVPHAFIIEKKHGPFTYYYVVTKK
jgi:hypothetical protein